MLNFFFSFVLVSLPLYCNGTLQILSSYSKSIPDMPIPCIYMDTLKQLELTQVKSPSANIKGLFISETPPCFIKTWPKHYKYTDNFKRAITSGFYEDYPHLLYCIIDEEHNIRGYIMNKLSRRKIHLSRVKEPSKKRRIDSAEKQVEGYKKILTFLIDKFEKTHLIYFDLAERNLMYDQKGQLTLTDLEIVAHPHELLASKRGLVKSLYSRLPLEYRKVIEKEYPFLKNY